MRLLVINTINDSSCMRLRRQYPGQPQRRPMIRGLPLVGRRVLQSEDLKSADVDRLEYLVSIGNIRVIELGAHRTAVDFDSLRRLLKFKKDVPATAEIPSVEMIEQEVLVQSTAAPDEVVPDVVGDVVIEAVEVSADSVLDACGADELEVVPEVATPEIWIMPDSLDELISTSKNVPLMRALVIFGDSGTGKNKSKLVSEVTARFGQEDIDAATKLKALAILQAAGEDP